MVNYSLLEKQLFSLMEGSRKPLSVLANASALLWEALPDINWAGFYLAQESVLYLGPFQGKTACTVIPFGKGVCGTAAASGAVQLVPDVHLFPGHIACDSASNAESVIPMFVDGTLIGVLDIDSPVKNRFTDDDVQGLSALCRQIETYATWQNGLL